MREAGNKRMESKHGNQLIGILIILLGVYWACRALDLIQFSIFFRGWWTLFIIIPSLMGLRDGKSRSSHIVGLLIGVMLLLWRQHLLPGSYLPALILGMIFILIGLYIMLGGSKSKSKQQGNYNYSESQQYSYEQDTYQESRSYEETSKNAVRDEATSQETKEQSTGETAKTTSQSYSNFETCPPNISAFLVGKSVSCLRGEFKGTNVQAILGNVQLDLRQAIIEQDVTVNMSLILGGADIYLPENVRVICETQSILGDVRDVRAGLRNMDSGQPAIHITGTCVLGGIELK